MKRSNDEIYFEETKRKEIKLTTTRCQVIITLDETIGSTLLHHKFKYQTTELQLFLQNVPVLHWYPIPLIGTTFDHIDSCIFSAVIRNNFYNWINIIEDMLNVYRNDEIMYRNDENMKRSKQKIEKLLKSLLNDELFILQALEEFKKGENNKNPLEYISDQLKDDEKFMLKVIKINNDSIKYASDRLRTILLKVIEKEKIMLEANESGSKLEPNILQKLKKNNYHPFRSSNRLNNNVKEVIKHNTIRLQYTSNILKLYRHNYPTFKYDRFNEEIVLDFKYFNYASRRLKDNEFIVLEAVQKNGNALQYASDRFKDNEEIVLEAIKQNRYALEYASDRLKDNEQIVLEAVKQYHDVFDFASDRLKDNEEFVLQVINQNGEALYSVSDRLKDNEKIVLEAIKQNGKVLCFASVRLKNDFNFAKEIFNNCNTFAVFKFFGVELRNIEFIYYYIENYQSNFHELIRKNTRRRELNVYDNFFKIIDRFNALQRPKINTVEDDWLFNFLFK